MSICTKCGKELPDGAAFCPWCGKRLGPAPPRKKLKRANGSGTVYKAAERRKKPWIARKNHVFIGYYSTKTEALEALERARDVEINDRYNATFAEVFALWSAEHFRDLSPKGVEQYNGAYKHCAPLYDLRYRSIKLDQYQAVIDAMVDKGLGLSSTDKVKQLLGQLNKWAIREDLVHKNQAQFLRLPDEAKKEKEIFTDEEIEKLWGAALDPAAQIVLILIYSGMRIGELFGLQRANVHLDEGYMVGGSKTEAGRDRLIAIHPKTMPFVAALYAAAPDGGLLIDGYTGQKVAANFRRREYYPLLDRLGIPRRSPHCTRHTFASLMVRAGARPEVLQKQLGHANYSTTADIYVHEGLDDLLNAVNLI